MNAITFDSLAWTLLHSLWQAAVAGALLWLVLRQMPARSASRRYTLSIAAMVMVVLGAMVTLAVLSLPSPAEQLATDSSDASHNVGVRGGTPTSAYTEYSSAPSTASPLPISTPTSHPPEKSSESLSTSRWAPAVVWLWLGGMGVMLCRVIGALRGAKKLVDQAQPCSDNLVLDMLNRLCASLGLVRTVALRIHQSLRVPAVVGILRPVILLPAGAMSGLTPYQLEAILLHELAHVRRNDLLVQIGQMLVEAIFFFNPAVWWISRQLRIEREACADHAATRVLGKPDQYVQVLADWAQRLLAPDPSANPTPAPITAAAMALTGPERPGTLLDRAKRLLIPGYKPKVRLPWHTIVGVLLICPLLVFGLWRGTDAAVQQVAKALSPQERITAIQQVQQTHGDEVQTDYDPNDPTQRVTVSGSVLAEDGSPVPEKLQVGLSAFVTRQRHSHSTIGATVRYSQGHFESPSIEPADVFFITAHHPDFAPCFAGPLKTKPGVPIEDVQVVLSRGFSSTIRLISTDGQPVPKALVNHTYKIKQEDETIYLPSEGPKVTNRNGEILLAHATNLPLSVDIRAAGYQSETFELTPKAGLNELKLRVAKPTTGRIVDSITGKPLAGATVYLVGGKGFSFDPMQTEQLVVLATSDDEGHFVLDTLPDEASHSLRIDAPDYGPEMVYDIHAGQTGLTWKLGPPRVLHVQITDGLDQLRKNNGQLELEYEISVEVAPSSTDRSYHYAPVTIVQTESGPVGQCQTKSLLPGTLRINLVSPPIILNTRSLPVEPLSINLNKAIQAKRDMREIVLRVTTPAGMPKAQGSLRLDYLETAKSAGYTPVMMIPLKEGEAHYQVPVPTKVITRGLNTPGYWIPEKRDQKVEPGEGPLVIDLPAIPAGAVYGIVTGPDGAPTRNVSLSLNATKEPALPENIRLDLYNLYEEGPNAEGRFVLSSIPLGGEYRLSVSQGECRVISPPLTLDNAKPLHDINMKLVEGVTVTASVVDEAGRPVVGIPVNLSYSLPWGFGVSGVDHLTDKNGQIVLEHVNPELPGTYSLYIKSTSRLQGISTPISPGGNPVKIVMKKGLHLEGTVHDVSTGKPVANARISVASTTIAGHGAETVADEQGRFVFDSLEDSDYRVIVEGAWSEGTTQFQQNGSTWYQLPQKDVNHYRPQKDPVQVRVTTNPPPRSE